MNMPEREREGVNTGGQNLRTYGILKLFNVMVTSFCISGGGGGGGSGRSTHSPESDPNACRRVRGIALHALCSNEESSHILAGTNCDATEPSCY